MFDVRISAAVGAMLTASATALAQTEPGGTEAIVIAPIEVRATPIGDPKGPVEGYKADRSQTGTRIDAPLAEQPLPIQVLPREIIEDVNAARLDDVVRFATGAVTGNTLGGTQERFVIRGFPASVATNGVISGGALDIQRQTDTANIERVEVLRGPGSALFGQGSPGGIVNVITKRPTDTFAVEGTSEATSLVRLRQELDLNVPISAAGDVNGRVVGAIEGTDSFRFRDDFSQSFPENRRFLAPSLSFSPSERTGVIISGEYLRSIDVFDRGVPLNDDGSFATDIDAFFGDEDAGTIRTEEFNGQVEINHELRDNLSLRLFGSAIRSDYSGFSLEPEVLIPVGADVPPGLVPGDTILRQFEFRAQTTEIYTMQTDLNARLVTGPLTHDLLASFEYQRAALDTMFEQSGTLTNPDPVSLGAPGTPSPLTRDDLVLINDEKTTINAYGFIFYDKVSMFDRLHVLAGGRVDVLDQSVTDELDGGSVTGIDVTEFSPRIGAVVEPFADLPASLFVSYSGSFQPNTRPAFDGGVIDPQEGRVIEGGARYTFNDERLELALTLFDIELDNVPLATEGTLFTTSSQQSRGVELSLQGQLTPNLSMLASYAFVDAKVTDIGPGGSRQAIGEAPQGVPEHSINLLTRYDFDDGMLEGLSLTGALRYAGRRVNFQSTTQPNPFGDPIQFDAIELEPFVRIDVGVAYAFNENVRLEAGVQNLLNQEIASPSTINLAIPEPPLTGFGRLSLRF